MTAGVEVVYTKDSDADIFIMAEAKAQRQAGAPRVVVVSGDAEISASLEYGSAMGWMTSEMYMLEMKRASRLFVHLASTDAVTCGTISMCASLPNCMLSSGGHARSRSSVGELRVPSMHRILDYFDFDSPACVVRLKRTYRSLCI